MPIDLANYDSKAKEATKLFWKKRIAAAQKQRVSGKKDQGERAGVTSGKNMDGFVDLAKEIVHANGLAHAEITLTRSLLTLPGFFRPTKVWDMLVLDEGELIAALEFKSQVGPSFGNNFNNRTEEAIGTAHDLQKAIRDGAFGADAPRPFVGWLMLLEDTDRSRSAVRNTSPHFDVFPEFDGSSYADRYDILCRKLVQENLYSSAALMLSKRSSKESGEYTSLSETSSLASFVTGLAGHVASVAALRKESGAKAFQLT